MLSHSASFKVPHRPHTIPALYAAPALLSSRPGVFPSHRMLLERFSTNSDAPEEPQPKHSNRHDQSVTLHNVNNDSQQHTAATSTGRRTHTHQ